MISEEKIAWLRLLRTPRIGRITFYHLLNVFSSAVLAIEGLDDYLNKLGKKTRYNISSKESVMKFLLECEKNCVKLIFSCDSEYPKNFLNCVDCSPILFCKGNISLFNRNVFAIVGSRTASFQGISFTKKLIKDLSDLVIISGFARGIDTAAHEASLDRGTIAVLGTGVNYVYPEENKILYEKIISNNGLIVSEIGLDEMPKPNFFAYRNRIISGIAKGVLVVEAAMNSGSLITAKYAGEQGRSVFAVPGHPYDIRSSGTNYLIKNGAVLVRNAEDVLQEFSAYSYNTVLNENSYSRIQECCVEDAKIMLKNMLGRAPITISEIVCMSKQDVSTVHAALAELELEDFLTIENNFVSLV